MGWRDAPTAADPARARRIVLRNYLTRPADAYDGHQTQPATPPAATHRLKKGHIMTNATHTIAQASCDWNRSGSKCHYNHHTGEVSWAAENGGAWTAPDANPDGTDVVPDFAKAEWSQMAAPTWSA